MFIDMIVMHMMQMAIMDIIYVAIVHNRGVTASDAVDMIMVIMMLENTI